MKKKEKAYPKKICYMGVSNVPFNSDKCEWYDEFCFDNIELYKEMIYSPIFKEIREKGGYPFLDFFCSQEFINYPSLEEAIGIIEKHKNEKQYQQIKEYLDVFLQFAKFAFEKKTFLCFEIQ